MLDPTKHGAYVVSQVARRDVGHKVIVASLLRSRRAGVGQHFEPVPQLDQVRIGHRLLHPRGLHVSDLIIFTFCGIAIVAPTLPVTATG